MTVYCASDVHLRLDRPQRGLRLARFASVLEPEDHLFIVGDLCDFWYASRQSDTEARLCPGLRSLVRFRECGGSITILPGNHDAWLGPFYERILGAEMRAEPVEFEAHGLRVHLVHGHLLGGRKRWKAVLESRTFLDAFGYVPGPLASRLDWLLERSNDKNRAAGDRRHLSVYRRYASQLSGSVDLLVCGHIHNPLDDDSKRPRLVILGGWHDRASYLRIDPSGAALIIQDDPGTALKNWDDSNAIATTQMTSG